MPMPMANTKPNLSPCTWYVEKAMPMPMANTKSNLRLCTWYVENAMLMANTKTNLSPMHIGEAPDRGTWRTRCRWRGEREALCDDEPLHVVRGEHKDAQYKPSATMSPLHVVHGERKDAKTPNISPLRR